jgi:hypothetical protein
MGWAGNVAHIEEECIQDIVGEARRRDTTRKI